MIGMPYYSEPLLSNLSSTDYAPVTSPFFKPPEPLPESVLSTMRMVDFVGYAAMPKELKGKRYAVHPCPDAGMPVAVRGEARRDSMPRFRSNKDRHRNSISPEVEEEVSLNLGLRTDCRRSQGKCPEITARLRSNIQNSASRISTLGRYATSKSS